MFLHVQTFGKQLSIQTEEEDTLRTVIEKAMQHWQQNETNFIVKNDSGDELDLNKSPASNALNENDLVVVSLVETKKRKNATKTN